MLCSLHEFARNILSTLNWLEPSTGDEDLAWKLDSLDLWTEMPQYANQTVLIMFML